MTKKKMLVADDELAVLIDCGAVVAGCGVVSTEMNWEWRLRRK